MTTQVDDSEEPTAEMIRAQHILFHESMGKSLEEATNLVCKEIAIREAWGYPPLKPIDVPDADHAGQYGSLWG